MSLYWFGIYPLLPSTDEDIKAIVQAAFDQLNTLDPFLALNMPLLWQGDNS